MVNTGGEFSRGVFNIRVSNQRFDWLNDASPPTSFGSASVTH